jgi:nucleotide-binding universal stress UspA family protein
MYKKMLVLLDGSKLAEIVFTYAQELSARLSITLELLHVCSPQEAEQLPMRQAYMEHMAEILQSKAAKISSKIGGTTQGKSIEAQGKVVVGHPAEEILNYADKNNIDLIMLSTHGRSGIRMWDLGNVAHKVIHAAKVPIWLVPSELREEIIWDKLPKRTMVIPLDGSKLSADVIPHAINIAKQRGAPSEIVLIYVEPTELVHTREEMKLVEAKSLSIKKYLDDQAQQFSKEGIPAQSKILMGDPASEIIDFVKGNPAQLIAMTTHGRVGINRMIFGSVAENIIHLVKKTPIFLVKPSKLIE